MDEDPWNWDVDRVVKELCTQERSWTHQISPEEMPDAAEFEAKLREYNVEGGGLLSALDLEFMRELGVSSFKHRQSLNYIIRELRLQSPSYSEFAFGHALKSLLPPSSQPGALPIDRKRPAEDETTQGPSKKPKLGSESALSVGPAVASSPDHMNGLEDDESALAQQLSLDDELPQVLHDPELSEQAPAVQIVDGRKRIVPTLIASIDPDRVRSVSLARSTISLNGNEIDISDTAGNAIAQGETELSHLVHDSVSRVAHTKSGVDRRDDRLARGDLGKEKMPVDDIFYGKGLAGLEEDQEDASDHFAFHGHQISGGRRIYVNSLMKRYLRQNNVDRVHQFTRNGKNYSAIIPYPGRLLPPHKERSFTLLYTSDGIVHASRQAVSKWPELVIDDESQISTVPGHSGQHTNATTPNGFPMLSEFNVDYDAIAAKYMNVPGGDEELPAFGDSGSEGEYDFETWKEMEDELREKTKGKLEKIELVPRGEPLSSEQVLSAIDEGIATLVRNWHTAKLPKLAARAYLTFQKYLRKGNHAKKSRRNELREENSHINEERIPKQRKEIAGEVWTHLNQVQRQVMGSMEVSIFNREQNLWELALLKSKTSPPKPAKMPAKAKKEVPTINLADGEELLGSDTESESEDDLGDFIDDDDEMMEDATAGPSDDDSDDSSEAEEETGKNITKVPLRLVTPGAEPCSSPRLPFWNSVGDDHVVPNGPSEDDMQPPPHRPSSSTPETLKRSATQSNIVDLTILSDTPGSESLRTPRTPQKESSARPISDSSKRPQGPIDLVTPKKDRTLTIRANGKANVIIISSSDSESKSSPLSKPLAPLSKPPVPLPSLESLPKHRELAKVAAVNYDIFTRSGDRDRLIIKFLYLMKPQELRDNLLAEFQRTEESIMWTTFQDVLQAMHYNQEISNMETSTFETYVALVRTFRTYVECKRGPVFRTKDGKYTEITRQVVGELETRKDLFSKLYKLVLDFAKTVEEDAKEAAESDTEDTEDSEEEMPLVRPKARVSPFGKGSSAQVTEEDEQTETGLLSAQKKKKRKLVENKEARELRESNKERIEKQRQRRLELQDKLASQGMSTANDIGHIIINEGKLEDEGFIYIDESIGRRIKPHQISGVRFMWEQIVTDSRNMQGCLLAHTMGLGKTMQVITLLVAIANAAKSEDESVRKQIPKKLSFSRTLVLCPPGLVDNWEDELLTWAPQNTIGDPYKVNSQMELSKRIEIIQDWHDTGGVLILGYDMFRIMMANTASKTRRAPLSEEQYEMLQEQLLEGPNIIVADEAHKLKNTSSQISAAASRFKSTSRIALTGSPLNNNVEEYHSMIDWVAPNYLGPIKEFRSKYVFPIEKGLWVDSDKASRRKSKKMLAVLISELELKVNRANMSVLRNDLPPKKEFVIRVALTKLQKEAYLIYVGHMRSASARELVPVSKDGTLSQATLWSWLADLSLLCNHPSNFKRKIAQIDPNRAAVEVENSRLSVDDDDDEQASSNQEAQLAAQKAIVKTGTKEKIMALLNNVVDIEAPELSNKMLLLFKILDECQSAGDKVLVFTQSIPTLNYLESACKNGGRRYLRLDGNTKMNSRQALTKSFNTTGFDVFLISTQAGSLGLNLFAANRVIIFDFKYNPTQEEQAIGRAYRIGQEKPVFVYRFVAAGTYEIHIENKAVYKMQLASRVVDKENPVAWAKNTTAAYLDDPEDVEQEDLAKFHGEDVVLDKILKDNNTGSVIRSIMKTDTFAEADEDDLTAEDKQEVDQFIKDAKFQREDPKGFEKEMQRRLKAQNEATHRRVAAENEALQRSLKAESDANKAREAAEEAARKAAREVRRAAAAIAVANADAQKQAALATAAQQKSAASQSNSSQARAASQTPVQRKVSPGVSKTQKQGSQSGSKSSSTELPTKATPHKSKPAVESLVPGGNQSQQPKTAKDSQKKAPRSTAENELQPIGKTPPPNPANKGSTGNAQKSEVRTQSASAKPPSLAIPIPGAFTKAVSPSTEAGTKPKQSTEASHAPEPISADNKDKAPAIHEKDSKAAVAKSSEPSIVDAPAQQPASTLSVSNMDGAADEGNKKSGFLARTLGRFAGSKD